MIDDPSASCTPGEILKGQGNKNKNAKVLPHAIIYLGSRDADTFRGAMLTTSGKFPENILMKQEHFQTHDSLGNAYPLQFKASRVVQRNFIKKNEWKPFTKVGELTAAGLAFVQSQLKGLNEQYFAGNAD